MQQYNAPYGGLDKAAKGKRFIRLGVTLALCGLVLLVWPSPWVLIFTAVAVGLGLWVDSYELRRWQRFEHDMPTECELLADIYVYLRSVGYEGKPRIISHGNSLALVQLLQHSTRVVFWSPQGAFALSYFNGAQYVWPVNMDIAHTRGQLLDQLGGLLASWVFEDHGGQVVPDLAYLLSTLRKGQLVMYADLDPTPLPTGPEVTT